MIDDSCAILRLDLKKRKLPVDLVKLAEIAISPDFALRLYAFVAPPDVDAYLPVLISFNGEARR